MGGAAKQTGQSTKDLAQKIANRMAREPLEILKEAGDRVTGVEVPKPQEKFSPSQNPDVQTSPARQQAELKDKERVDRGLAAHRRELEDMRKGNLLKELQAKISQGEEVSLQNYPGLSLEQKQVLKAQMQAVKVRGEIAKNTDKKSLIEPITKKGRQLFNFGKKTAVKREQTHVERPVQSST
jgi:hypothetical protein